MHLIRINKAVQSIRTAITTPWSACVFEGAKYDLATCLYVVNHDRNSMLNHLKSELICRQNNEKLIGNDRLGVGMSMNLVVLDTSSRNGSIEFIVKIPTRASCIVNCQLRGHLPDATVMLNRTE